MKKLILLTSFICGMLQAKAQISVAPEIGANLSSATVSRIVHNQHDPDIGNIKHRAGLRIGVMVNVPLGKGFFVQPGIFAPLKGHSYSMLSSSSGISEEYRITTNPVYVEIPVQLGYELRISKVSGIFFTAGVYGAYMVSGTSKNELLIEGQLRNGIGAPADIKRADFGTAFSTGYKLGKRAFARVQYSLGLKNIARDESLDIKKQSLSLTIGYAVSIK